jgi:hypothetical protein
MQIADININQTNWWVKHPCFGLKQIPNATMTATTACAADLIGGSTIHMYMAKNRKAKNKRIIVDEVSMMGSVLFE